MQNHHSIWQRLKNQEINCEQALKILVDDQGVVNLGLLDPEVSQRFLRQFSDRKTIPPVIPLLLWRNCYFLGSSVPLTPDIIKKISQQTATDIKFVPIKHQSYRDWVHRYNQANNHRLSSTSSPDYSDKEAPKVENLSESTEISLSKAADQISRIKAIISSALRSRASDIHLEPMPNGLRVRYRIDGILRNITTLPLEVSRKAIIALKVMSEMDISESRRPQDARISDKYMSAQDSEQSLDMRVSTLPCIGGEKAVIRLLPRENNFSSIEELGFSDRTLATYKHWLQQPQGMIIFTGPTGSGKTSTLYTSLQRLAEEHVNLVTVENPVEYVLPGITQTQVHEVAGMTFAAGLRAILRQDPDIIMIGEIRDRETAETAVRAALTGHLVLTTLHTNDALSAIPRLKDLCPDAGFISDALLGVVAQRLVRKVCPHCAEKYTPTEADLKVLGLDTEQAKTANWRYGKGCRQCFNSGYLGREALVELLNIDDSIRQIIYEGTMTQLQHYVRGANFDSFRLAAIAKVTTGVTTVQEILRVLPHSSLYSKPVTSTKLEQHRNLLNVN
ncbi:GspE/PulE family protein [Synechocystis sp. PCC 7509]|uniref:GspE/PulE family protein n=1 Tax=Synechocystis sp. PCC 7509 TaxID=927677 RepID=UPI0002ABA506|nr:GspE/PulE family protein [Synechocystis sp. PCC 7509]